MNIKKIFVLFCLISNFFFYEISAIKSSFWTDSNVSDESESDVSNNVSYDNSDDEHIPGTTAINAELDTYFLEKNSVVSNIKSKRNNNFNPSIFVDAIFDDGNGCRIYTYSQYGSLLDTFNQTMIFLNDEHVCYPTYNFTKRDIKIVGGHVIVLSDFEYDQGDCSFAPKKNIRVAPNNPDQEDSDDERDENKKYIDKFQVNNQLSGALSIFNGTWTFRNNENNGIYPKSSTVVAVNSKEEYFNIILPIIAACVDFMKHRSCNDGQIRLSKDKTEADYLRGLLRSEYKKYNFLTYTIEYKYSDEISFIMHVAKKKNSDVYFVSTIYPSQSAV